MTLADMIGVFDEKNRKSDNTGSYNELKKYLYKVGSSPIRNVRFDLYHKWLLL